MRGTKESNHAVAVSDLTIQKCEARNSRALDHHLEFFVWRNH